jgi:hypothetical protein
MQMYNNKTHQDKDLPHEIFRFQLKFHSLCHLNNIIFFYLILLLSFHINVIIKYENGL